MIEPYRKKVLTEKVKESLYVSRL